MAVLVTCQIASANVFSALPGTDTFAPTVWTEIEEAWSQAPDDYIPRTRHLRDDGTPLYANRLLLAVSPYLRQHAHNPVNWYPWGEEALNRARLEQKPVLVSIGYSSCHWCHVMEEESFDDLGVAEFLNKHFIAIKVDRETNPDIDEVYLLALNVMSGQGGWPLNVFMTADGGPFFGMTYVPRGDLLDILLQVHTAWNSQRAQVERIATAVTQAVQNFGMVATGDVDIGDNETARLIAEVAQREASIDEFSPPMSRFPSESELLLLLDSAFRHQSRTALELAQGRLTAMALGGIRDHAGGGFHRYTVDTEWLTPHFEKMLYNQALLARAYLIAYQFTGKDLYRRVAVETLDYVLRDLRSEDGTFYSAWDADSQGVEGRFYLWTVEELRHAAGDMANFAIKVFGATENGNYEGLNILHLNTLPEEQALDSGLKLPQHLQQLALVKERLRVYREHRQKPYLDTKVITAWNALMIETLVLGSEVLGDDRYAQSAERAAELIWNRLRDNNGRLYRILLDGKRNELGKLRDYAYLTQAAIRLYDRTDKRLWLERAESLAKAMNDEFWDETSGGYFSVAKNDMPQLVIRQKDRFDEGLPSGNSVAAMSFALLYQRTGKLMYSKRAEQIIDVFAAEINSSPSAFPYALSAVEVQRRGLLGKRDYAAQGHALVSVDIKQRIQDRVRAVVKLKLDEGWHVQSDQPSNDNLHATGVESLSKAWLLRDSHFPQSQTLLASFQSEPLSVFAGSVSIPIELEPVGTGSGIIELEVSFQACSDELCLLPETVQLEIPITQIKG